MVHVHHSFCIYDTIDLVRGVNMIKVILFDMDGTLIDSDELVIKIYEELIKKYPPDVLFDSLDKGEVFALSYPDVLKKLYDEVLEEHLSLIYRIHERLKHKYLKLFPGVLEALKTFKNQGYRIGLLTSELRGIAMDELKILKIDSFFDHIVSYDDVLQPKPNPEGIFQHMAYFQCTNEEMIYIGDQKSDGMTAYNAHVYSVIMDWYHQKTLAYIHLFDHVAHDIDELKDIIRYLNHSTIIMGENNKLRIMQLTDLHLMADEKDALTYALISDLVTHEMPDFIVLTGDQTMSKDAPMLYQMLGSFMDTLNTPYTYVFGNHDTEDGNTYETLIEAISKSKMLMFNAGPKHLGYGNHLILIKNKCHQNVLSLIMMDTHVDDTYAIQGDMVWGYGCMSNDQIAWYERMLSLFPYPHLLFFHIPIFEVREAIDVIGEYNENPSTPPVKTRLLDVAKHHQGKGMFFGHDHYNDFIFHKDDVLLAHGRVSGHYDYGAPGFPKGGRMIEIDQKGNINTYVILHQDIKKT